MLDYNPTDSNAIAQAFRDMMDGAKSPRDLQRANAYANYMQAQRLPGELGIEAQQAVTQHPFAWNMANPYAAAMETVQEKLPWGYESDRSQAAVRQPSLQDAIMNLIRLPNLGGAPGRAEDRQRWLDERSAQRVASMPQRPTQAAYGMPGYGLGQVNGQQVLYPEHGYNQSAANQALASDPRGNPRALPADGMGGLDARAVAGMLQGDARTRQQMLAQQANAARAAKQADWNHELDLEAAKGRNNMAVTSLQNQGKLAATKTGGPNTQLVDAYTRWVESQRKAWQSALDAGQSVGPFQAIDYRDWVGSLQAERNRNPGGVVAFLQGLVGGQPSAPQTSSYAGEAEQQYQAEMDRRGGRTFEQNYQNARGGGSGGGDPAKDWAAFSASEQALIRRNMQASLSDPNVPPAAKQQIRTYLAQHPQAGHGPRPMAPKPAGGY